MARKGDVARAAIAIIIVCLIMALTGGCEEAQKRPTWGNGDPPVSWIETFGNDNIARMDYVQMQMFSQMNARIKVLEDFCRVGNDPNGVK